MERRKSHISFDERSSGKARFRTQKWFKQLKKIPNKWRKIALLVLVIIVIAGGVFAGYKILSASTPESRMREIADDYYADKIETAAKRSSSYTLILKNMKRIGYDVSYFEKEGCSLDSYAIIYLHDGANGSNDKASYDVETKLIDCE